MRFLKNFVWVFIGVVVLGCEGTTSETTELIDFIPENTSIVLKISNPIGSETGIEALQRTLISNSLISAFKQTKPYSFFSENAPLLKYLNPASESLLCINTPTDSTTVYTIITRAHPNLFVVDSIKNKTIETLSYNNMSLQRVTIDNQIAFTAVKDSTFIASSSQTMLQHILEGRTEQNETFRRIARIQQGEDLNLIVNTSSLPLNDSTEVNFASWMSLDVEILPNAISATGVAMAKDSVPQLLSVFEGLLPRQNDLAHIIPNDAISAVSFTYNDVELFLNNLQYYRGRKSSDSLVNPLFESINEVGLVQLPSGQAVVLKSIDPILTDDSLLKYITENSSFREVTIYNFSDSDLFTETFSPILPRVTPSYAFQLDNFFVFSESVADAEHIITAFKNNSCLAKMGYFESATSQLSTASSLLLYRMQGSIQGAVSNFFSTSVAPKIKNASLKSYPFAAIQFSYDRDFAHVNLICQEAGNSIESPGGITQLFGLELDLKLLTRPQFFSNHRTGGQDVVVQDANNTLYLISESGKVLWTKNLSGPILGTIHEVDLLRNGKKQLAFTTKNAFYVLDRNGKPVAPFPINFKDAVTQPLAVFDYDNNRKYRFVVTQGKNILMYDAKAQLVNGFTYKSATSTIVMPPQHIRMGNKDYLLVAEESGKLNILNRVGATRIKVTKKFEFSEIPIAEEANHFVVITKENHKESIDQNGKITSQKLEVSEAYYFSVKGTTKVTMDDNKLRINGKLIELPFGIYSKPTAFILNKETYVSVTETQEKKVFIFNKSGILFPGFPVYGTSTIDMGASSQRGKVIFVTQGSGKEVLLYLLQ
jgi:hypothetical protein